MRRVLVIGYGNTLRGDDAAGIHAAEKIAIKLPNIECVLVHQLMPELAEKIAESNLVFFLDAEVDIQKIKVRTIIPAEEASRPHSHNISPETLLTISRQLYGQVPQKVVVVGIPAFHFDFSEQLSEATQKFVEESVSIVVSMIEEEEIVV